MKRFLAIILAGLMLLTLVACGEKKDDNVDRRGALHAENSMKFTSSAHQEHKEKANESNRETIYYNNLSAAILDLESGKIGSIFAEEHTAAYMVARNENLTYINRDRTTNYSMMTLDSNKEVYDILNNAIKDMKADGTLDSLIANELKAYIETDPAPKDLPHFDGAKTIKVGITGDIPPMDFVAANGKAAGFNIALLTEIANRAQVNIELVQIEAGARPMALSSGKVDAVFWTLSVTCNTCGETIYEKIDGTLATETYCSANNTRIKLKSEK